MTKEEDTLNPFLGVGKYIQQTWPGAYLLRGLPFFKSHEQDSFEVVMAAALSWRALPPSQRRPIFLSRTWAGWSGRTQFRHYSCHCNRPRVAFREDYYGS
jgi:hypothetical protein